MSGFTTIPEGANNPFELTPEEQNRRKTGICCYNLLGLVATGAFICGIYSYAYCDFLQRTAVLNDAYTADDYETACGDLGYSTDGDRADNQICQSILQSHGIGFAYWQATVPVDQKVCLTYTQATPWGFVTPDFDARFNTSRAFSIMGYIFGGAAWFTLTCSSCFKMDQQRLKGLTCYFLFASFCQGLSLLMFASDVCSKGFFEVYFVPPSQRNNATYLDDFNSVVEDVECQQGLGSKMAISATVLWFVSALMVPFSVVPFYEPRYYQSDYDAAMREQQEAAAAAAGGDGQPQAP